MKTLKALVLIFVSASLAYAELTTQKVGDYTLSLQSSGEIGKASWIQELAIKNQQGQVIYTDKAPNPLSWLVLYPQTCTVADGYSWFGYGRLQDGLDGSRIFSIAIKNNVAYVSSADFVPQEPDFVEKQTSEQLAPELSKEIAIKMLQAVLDAYRANLN